MGDDHGSGADHRGRLTANGVPEATGRKAEYGRVRWRCRRGMKELDVVLERYLDRRYAAADDDERGAFRRLLDADDPVLWDWISGAMPVSDASLEQIVALVRDCR